jgi:2-dehydropantoate 2-reductase
MRIRIGILGIGGVGGYFGGKLAKAYQNSDKVEIVFIARGDAQKNIALYGLKIISDDEEIVVYPSIVSNNTEDIGVLDYLICSTKTYDLENSLKTLKKCLNSQTIILPLYNGVDAPDRIQKIFPENIVLMGCVYIVSHIVSPGVIKKTGVYETLFFGSKTAPVSKLKELQTIFEEATIQSFLMDNIEGIVWEKFIFISALASVTSYWNQNIAGILNHSECKENYISLLREIIAVANAKEIVLSENILELTIEKLKKSPQEATSSMHRDVLDGRKTEIKSLIEYVVNEGRKLGIATPNYTLILNKLS